MLHESPTVFALCQPRGTHIVSGRGGKQILLEDPSGNCVELFELPPD